MSDIFSGLDPMRFFELIAKRKQKIASADGIIPERSVNALAKELHPKTQNLRVKEIIPQGDNTKTFIFEPDTQAGTKSHAYFSAGQYISVRVEVDGYINSRPYSLVSSPKESLEGRYAITVKGTHGGVVSQFILENFKVGCSVEVSEPMGTFTYEPLRDSEHIIGVAGGSGVTPFVSLAKAIADNDEPCSLTLLYGCRTLADRPHFCELDSLCARCDRLKVVYVLSEERAQGYLHGVITADIIRELASKDGYSLFICGPRALHEHMDREALSLGLERKYVRHEVFGEAFLPSMRDKTVRVTVIKDGESSTLTGSGEESILRILERNKISAQSRCRSGECGFCRTRLVSGRVIIPDKTDRRRAADEKHGYIHPCCTYASGDITIKLD